MHRINTYQPDDKNLNLPDQEPTRALTEFLKSMLWVGQVVGANMWTRWIPWLYEIIWWYEPHVLSVDVLL